jgi:hypothetical protein
MVKLFNVLKPKTQILLVIKKCKKPKVIKFKNGSSITIIKEKESLNKRSKRSLLTKLFNSDGSVEYVLNREMFDEIINDFRK